jgi:hypothetical protein
MEMVKWLQFSPQNIWEISTTLYVHTLLKQAIGNEDVYNYGLALNGSMLQE